MALQTTTHSHVFANATALNESFALRLPVHNKQYAPRCFKVHSTGVQWAHTVSTSAP